MNRSTPPPDTLTIRGITFRAPCGVFAEERALKVDFSAKVTLTMDLAPAARADDLAHTVDYGDLAQRVIAIAHQTERLLVERLAEEIADGLLAAYPMVHTARVALTKPRPPVEGIQGGITVTIARSRP